MPAESNVIFAPVCNPLALVRNMPSAFRMKLERHDGSRHENRKRFATLWLQGPNQPKRRFVATDSSRQPTYCGHRRPRPRAPQLGREADLQGSPVKARCPPKETFLDVSAWSPYATLRLEPKLVLSARHVAGAPSSRAAQNSRNVAASEYDFCVPARVTESAA